MRVLSGVLKFLSKIPHYVLTTLLTFILILVMLVFIFIVAIKTSPHNSEKLILNAIHKSAAMFHIKHGDVGVKIENSIVTITIDSFAQRPAKVVLQGNKAVVTISLNKLWQGTLYEVKAKNFSVQINKVPDDDSTPVSTPNSIAKYYILMPSIKMFIENFTLNLYGNLITLQDAKLLVNELHHILAVQAHSKKDKYKLSIFLDRRDLTIVFDGLSSKLMHKHTDNAFNFIDFDSIGGKIIIDTHNIENIQYSCKGEGIKLLKSKFVGEDLLVQKASLLGYVNYGNMLLKISDAKIADKGKADISVKNENGIIDVSVQLENTPIDFAKRYVTSYVLKLSGIKSTFDYLMTSISGGLVKTVDVKVHSPVLEQNDVSVGVEFENTSLLYNEYFQKLYNASGSVSVNRDYTTVDVVSAQSGNNSLVNSRAVVNHGSRYLSLYLDVRGSPSFVANTFDVKNDYKIFDDYFKGKAQVQAFIGIDLKCGDVYACTNIKGSASFADVSLPFAQQNLAGTMKVTKKHNQDMSVNIHFDDFDYKYFNIREISGSHSLDIHKNILEIKNVSVVDKGKAEIFKIKLLKIPFKKKASLEIIDIPSVRLQNNNFGVKIYNSGNKKEVSIVGQAISVPESIEIWNDFNNYYKNGVAEHSGINKYLNYDLLVDVKKVSFFNEIVAPLYLNITKYGKNDGLIDIKSDLIQYHYYGFAKYGANSRTKLLIPNLNNILLAINKKDIPVYGKINLEGFYNNDGHLRWQGNVTGLKMHFNKFNFNPNEFRFEAKLANNVLSFDKIKMYDKNHTIFITGKILTDTLTINAKAYYTPSSIELLNSIPVVISVATLGQNKNGIMSLEFDIYGSIFTPEVKFNKASPIKSIWKLGISAVFLPLLLL